LSWDVDAVAEMYYRIRREHLSFFGGSLTPLALTIPQIHLPTLPDFEELLVIYYSALEPYLFRSLEVAQSLVENRPEGEPGLRPRPRGL
jgi:hypothetical protein